MKIDEEILAKEIIVKTSRSGGKGGQHVNKVSSKVELSFNPATSTLFDECQRQLLLSRLNHRIDNDGFLHVVSQQSRSQIENKKDAFTKLILLLENSVLVVKPRKASTLPRAIKLKRRLDKQNQSMKKMLRKKNDW